MRRLLIFWAVVLMPVVASAQCADTADTGCDTGASSDNLGEATLAGGGCVVGPRTEGWLLLLSLVALSRRRSA